MSKSTKTPAVKTFAEWLKMLPEGKLDDMQIVTVDLCLSIDNWVFAAKVAAAHGVSIDAVLSRILHQSDGLTDAWNTCPPQSASRKGACFELTSGPN
jgi:hypothetical protein